MALKLRGPNTQLNFAAHSYAHLMPLLAELDRVRAAGVAGCCGV